MAVTGSRIDPAEAERVAAEARRVLTGNRQSGISDWDGMRYDFVCPSPTHYPFQWFWDSAFHALAHLHVGPELSKQELRCLMQGAQPDGFIAHMLLWEREAHAHWLQHEYSIRGPTWVNVNWHPYWGLRAHGYDDVASELARRTVAMQSRGGIREFYDPFTSAGYGATDFGWSCLSLDLIAAEQSG